MDTIETRNPSLLFKNKFSTNSTPKRIFKNINQPFPNKCKRAFTDYDLELMYIDLDTKEIHILTDVERKAKAKLEKKERYRS